MARQVNDKLKTDILLFDVWVMNGDRTLSEQGGNVNLLYDTTLDKPIVVFDHNLALDKDENDINIRLHHVFSGDNAAIGGTIGTGVLISFWGFGDLILGLLVLFTRPK